MRKILKNILLLVLIGLSLNSCKNKHLVSSYYSSDTFESSVDTAIFVPYRKINKWFYVDRRKTGTYSGYAKAFESEWDRTFPFNKYNLAKVKNNQLYGYIDTTGKIVIPVQIETELLWDFTDSILVLIDKNDLYGGINVSGDTIIPFEYKYLGEFIHNSAVATTANNEVLLISNKGEILIQPGLYDYIGHASTIKDIGVFIYGLKAEDKTLYGILDNNYHKITEPVSSKIPTFSNGLGIIFKNNKYGFINKSGEEIIPCQYNRAEPFCNNLSTISQNNKYGLINSKGKEILPLEYDDLGICGVQNHIIPAKKNNNWGIIDSNGNVLVDYLYRNADNVSYKYGLVGVSDGEYSGMIDSLGNKVIDFKYHKLFKPKCITPNRILVTVDEGGKLKGIVNRKNEYITSIKYNRIGTEFEVFEHGLIPVTYNSNIDNGSGTAKISHGYIDIFGKEYFED